MDSRKEQGPAGKSDGQQYDLSYYIKPLHEKGRKNSPHDTSKKRCGSICRPQFNHCLAEEGIDVTLPVYGLMNCRHAYIEYMETGNIYFLPAIYGCDSCVNAYAQYTSSNTSVWFPISSVSKEGTIAGVTWI